MDKWERRELREDMRINKSDNHALMVEFLGLWIQAIINSVFTFGIMSDATKESLKLIKEFIKIANAENDLYYYLYKHSKPTENEVVGAYIDDLFTQNRKTFDYYMNCLDNILVACDLKKEYRIVRDKKNFATLIESNEYYAKLLEILIDEDDLLDYLGVSKEFLNFVNEDNLKTIYIDYNKLNEREFIGVNYKLDDNGLIKDLKLYVPSVISLETARIYIYVVYSAFELFKRMGQMISDEDILNISEEAKKKMEEYEIKYHEQEKKLLPHR